MMSSYLEAQLSLECCPAVPERPPCPMQAFPRNLWQRLCSSERRTCTPGALSGRCTRASRRAPSASPSPGGRPAARGRWTRGWGTRCARTRAGGQSAGRKPTAASARMALHTTSCRAPMTGTPSRGSRRDDAASHMRSGIKATIRLCWEGDYDS